jgi:hypothetical protein
MDPAIKGTGGITTGFREKLTKGDIKMSTDFKIKNPKASSVLGMYVDESVGMEHPLAKIKFQSEVDATLGYLGSKSLKEAIKSTLKHILFCLERIFLMSL